MASNYNRKSASSASRKTNPPQRNRSSSPPVRKSSISRGQGSSRGSNASRPNASRSTPPSRSNNSSWTPTVSRTANNLNSASLGKRGSGKNIRDYSRQGYTSVRIGDLDQTDRAHRAKKKYTRYIVRLSIIFGLITALLVGGFVLYNSSVFTVSEVSVVGVQHLTTTEMTELAAVPGGTTLLRVDTAGIEGRLLENAWVKQVSVNRVFPDKLELVVTERTIAAVVKIPVDNAQNTEDWAIASDGKWLMSIPPKDSDEATLISPKIYEDAEQVLHITDVPYGIAPEIGSYCVDDNVNNALAIIDGLTTDLADQVKTVSATGTENTTLTLDNGIEIAFGTSEDIREKERICLQLMEENPGKITYINVRVVDSPTYRSVS